MYFYSSVLSLASFSFNRESRYPGKDLANEEVLKCYSTLLNLLLILIDINYCCMRSYVPGPIPSTLNKSAHVVLNPVSKHYC